MQAINIKAIVFSLTIILYASSIMWMLLDVKFDKLPLKRRVSGVVFFIALILLNIIIQSFLGMEFYTRYYLLFTQLPVYIFFRIVSNYRNIKLLFVLLTAVIASSPVMITITVTRHFFPVPFWVYLVCYIVMASLIYKFFKNPFNYMLKHASNSIFALFIAIQSLYYIYGYALTQYQFADIVVNRLYLIRQIPLLIVLIAYVLLVYIFKMLSEKQELDNIQNIMALQLNAATDKIEQLKIAQNQTAIYHHDLRHHMNYIHSCIVQNKLKDATDYISETCEKIDDVMVKQYSNNESINLIVSAYVMKAEEKEIYSEIRIIATDFSKFAIFDLCSLIANAFENAILACESIDDSSNRYIKFFMYEKNNKLCFDIQNSYHIEPSFEDGIPCTKKEGHGFGTKSMAYVVEKYRGIYHFFTKDNIFIFQATM